jgi:hypothetical protein
MTENIRKNWFCVISKATFGEYGLHDIQTNSSWTDNPYSEGYATVPDDLVQDIMETKGYCDIVLNDEGTEVVSFTARDIPEIVEPEVVEPEPTTGEILDALLGVE